MTDDEERAYILGQKQAYRSMMAACISNLGGEAIDAESWRLERADVVNMLRQICADHGDNEWSDDLHLADVLEKHLWNHLENAGS